VTVDRTSESVAEAVLATIGVEGSCFARLSLGAPWTLAFPDCPGGGVGFQFVAAGRAWVIDGDATWNLEAGDLVVFPRATEHLVAHHADPVDKPLLMPALPGVHDAARHGGAGERTLLLTGGTRFTPAGHPLLDALPRVLLVRRRETDDGWVSATLELMSLEAARHRPGTETVLTRLTDILIIHAVRRWLDDDRTSTHGWLAALRDPHLGRAMLAMHRQPAAGWTVHALAREAAMSRAAFAARFAATTGVAPMTYLTRHRMTLATELLRDHELPVEQAATAVGYGSLAAFSRAYKRTTGESPTHARSAAVP
jgi:AraC-like DNA-binding protein